MVFKKGGKFLNNNIDINNLKKLSLGEFINILTNNNLNTSSKGIIESDRVIYNSEELLLNYPMFTKYSLDQAIKKMNLPYFRIGHKRFFEKDKIDQWINENYE